MIIKNDLAVSKSLLLKNFYDSVLKYAVFGSGPLTVLGGVEVGQNETYTKYMFSL